MLPLATLERSLALLYVVEALHKVPGVPLSRAGAGGAARIRASAQIGAHAAALTFWRVQYLGELERLRQVAAAVLEKLWSDRAKPGDPIVLGVFPGIEASNWNEARDTTRRHGRARE